MADDCLEKHFDCEKEVGLAMRSLWAQCLSTVVPITYVTPNVDANQ